MKTREDEGKTELGLMSRIFLASLLLRFESSALAVRCSLIGD